MLEKRWGNQYGKEDKIIDLIKNKSIIQTISPQFLIKRFDLSEEEAAAICLAMQEKGIVKPKYALRCPNCIRVLGVYETLNQTPEVEECMYCGQDAIERIDNLYINFEVIRE